MFVYSAKMDKKKLAAILICVAVAIAVIVLLFAGGGGGSDEPEAPQEPTQEELREQQIKTLKKARVKTNEDRLALIAKLGWEVENQPEEEIEVMIPSEFSDIYENYNKIQTAQGLDLSTHKGDSVMRYTYIVTNHPSGESDVRLTLLVYKNRLIGGDICTLRYDGFMHGLLMSDAVARMESGGDEDVSVITGEYGQEENVFPED